MKKLLAVFVIFATVFSLLSGRIVTANDSILLEAKNILSVPSDKVVNFSVDIPGLSSSVNNFELLDKGKKVHTQITRKTNNNIQLKALLHFSPLEDKKLTLKYGKDVVPDYQTIFKPDFSGTYFVGIGSGMLYIVSLHSSNAVKITDNKGKVLFQDTLGKDTAKSIPLLNNEEIFAIHSSYPVFAEVSSLKSHPLLSSSDDISCVYGSYFVLFIPKEIFVCAYKDTHLKLYTLSGSKIFDGNIPERGLYKNLSLKPDFYVVSSDNPVTVQFGCADDNVYFVGYGDLNAFKGVSFGNIVCSSLFPDTDLRIKTVEKLYPSVKLSKPGDFYYKNILKTFKLSNTEYAPVYVTHTKPVLIYSDANSGNVGGEQIPSLNGKGLSFVFRSGKINNFQGITHQRNVVIIASKDNTHITINNKKVTLNTLQTYRISNGESYRLINIDSDKPVSVFDVGISTSVEFLSMLLPIEDNSIKVVPLSVRPAVPSGKSVTGPTSFLLPVFAFFTSLWHSISNTSWYGSIGNTVKGLWTNVSPYIKNLSREIIEFFLPAAGLIYPYIHNHLPNISEYEIAAIIFYILLGLVILLFIPKRRKEKPLPVVNLQEAKKRMPAFNVKILEEKGPISIEAKSAKTIPVPTKIKKERPVPVSEKSKVLRKTIEPVKVSKTIPVTPKKEIKKAVIPHPISAPEKFKKAVVPHPKAKPVVKEIKPKKVEKKPILSKQWKPQEVKKPEAYEKPKVPETAKEKGKEISSQLKRLAEKKEIKVAKKPSPKKIPIYPEKKKKVSEETKSSLESLLERVKSESSKLGIEENKEELVPQGIEVGKKGIVPPAVKHFQSGVVMDVASLTKILQLKRAEYLNGVFISASSQSKLDSNIKAKYRIGVIALTPIELRIVEDLANRIASKNSTAEALLIAKKIRAKDILVDDSPIITDYQGIKIHSLREFIQ